MSSASHRFAELERRGSAMRAPDQMKSSFSQTCNLLSRYLKERGNFGNLNFEIARNSGKMESHSDEVATRKMDLSEMSADHGSYRDEMVASPKLKSMDLFPQQAGFGPSEDKLDSTSDETAKPVKAECEGAPLTIFYAGQVFVFENFPAEKAQELMVLASKGSTAANDHGIGSVATKTSTRPLDIDLNKVSFGGSSSSSAASAGLGSNACDSVNGSKPECSQRRSLHQAIASDLPIARRASLHRFLEKRKDRVGDRAPYQVISSIPAAAKEEESNIWLGLAN